jgi:hypothetical protein
LNPLRHALLAATSRSEGTVSMVLPSISYTDGNAYK